MPPDLVTTPFAAALVAVLNHLLRGQPWLRERLRRFPDRVARLESGPLRMAVSIQPDGLLCQAASGASEDAAVVLPPLALLQLAAGQDRARTQIDLRGDPALASALGGVLRELRWDFEEDLSRVTGDIAAHRIGQAARAVLGWQRLIAANLSQALVEYWTEEKPLLARRKELEHWAREVDELRDAVERLEQRTALVIDTRHR